MNTVVIDLPSDSYTDTHTHTTRIPLQQSMPNTTTQAPLPLTLLNQYPDCFPLKVQKHINYTIKTQLLPFHISSRYIELSCDEPTTQFLIQCCEEYNSSYISSYYIKNAFIKPLMKTYYNHTDCNGILGTGSMFVCSTQQGKLLLDKHINNTHTNDTILLDIGAGDGNVTLQLKPLFNTVYTTEVSDRMVHKLQAIHQFNCYQTTDIHYIFKDIKQHHNNISPSVITLFNVLDRCDHPIQLLRDIYNNMSSTSILLLAVVLPLKPSVENSDGTWSAPIQSIVTRGYTCCSTYEDSLTGLIDDIILPIGYTLQSISRVPYISAGDTVKPFYVLQDALIVLQK